MDEFGDRMKLYEGVEVNRRFIPLLPICVRLDGRCFSKFTKGLAKPYDSRLINIMIETTKFLVQETNAVIGYTQSDEISLILYSNNSKSQIFFDGRIQKVISTLAAICSVKFNELIKEHLPRKANKLPTFDCRAWQIPNLTEAVNTLIWREQDATRNSISSAAQSVYSHKQLQNKNCKEMQEMLFRKGINWNDYPNCFKRGTYVVRKKIRSKLTAEELASLPPQHHAHKNPDLEFERTIITELDIPPLAQVANREEVIFHGAAPIINLEKHDEHN